MVCSYIEALPDFEPLPYFWSKEEKEYLVGTDVESIVENYEVSRKIVKFVLNCF